MGMGDVEGGPKRMVRRYAAAWRMCREIGTQANGAPDVAGAARGSDFFAAIFGDDDSGMIGMDPAALAAWRKYVCENAPLPNPTTMRAHAPLGLPPRG